MGFSLFVHMERMSAKDRYPKLHDQFIELAQIADAGGMRTVWINTSGAPMADPFVMR